MTTALIVAGWLLVIATVLPLWRSDAWWVRGFDFPRLQIVILIVLVGAALALTSRPSGAADIALLVALAASAGWQVWMMRPYLRLAPVQVQKARRPEPDSTLRLLTANVLMTNRDATRLLAIVRDADPDVILAVETDGWWQQQLAALEQTHPHTVLQPQDNTYGMLMYSRLPLRDAQVKFLVQPDIPSIHARVVLPSGVEVTLHGLHPRPPFPTEDEVATERDAELLLVGQWIKAHEPGPTVVLGDLNDVAWSRTNYLFQDVSGLLDPRIGRGFFNTFHAQVPFMRFPLDHFFHSNEFRLIDFRRLGAFGSDHFPVFIALSHEPDAPREQPELQADAQQQQEAQEKVEKKNGLPKQPVSNSPA
jgi:endonuclease/exonuclease/phosphatase (EEP) superfamily protein YafD